MKFEKIEFNLVEFQEILKRTPSSFTLTFSLKFREILRIFSPIDSLHKILKQNMHTKTVSSTPLLLYKTTFHGCNGFIRQFYDNLRMYIPIKKTPHFYNIFTLYIQKKKSVLNCTQRVPEKI